MENNELDVGLGAAEKTCNVCNERKDLSFFSKHKTAPDGYQYKCKPCFAAWKRNPCAKLPKEVTRPRDPNVVRANLVGAPKGTYVPEKGAFARNDGLKHIPSRGLST